MLQNVVECSECLFCPMWDPGAQHASVTTFRVALVWVLSFLG